MAGGCPCLVVGAFFIPTPVHCPHYRNPLAVLGVMSNNRDTSKEQHQTRKVGIMRTITGTPTNAKLDSFINRKGTMKTTHYQTSDTNPPTGEEELIIKSSKNPQPLFQSRNGGKIHRQGCGQRSLNVSVLSDTKGMTFQEIIDKYGTDLCSYCFPEVATQTPATPAPAPGPAPCPGSGTFDWKGGKPTKTGYYTGNGGYCGHCGKWVSIARNQWGHKIRKHTTG